MIFWLHLFRVAWFVVVDRDTAVRYNCKLEFLLLVRYHRVQAVHRPYVHFHSSAPSICLFHISAIVCLLPKAYFSNPLQLPAADCSEKAFDHGRVLSP